MDKVLIACLDNLGDLVFASALAAPLRRAFPRARLGLWAKRYAGALAAFIPYIDRVHLSDPFWDGSPLGGKGPLGDYLRTAFEIRREGYEAALITRTRRKSAATLALCGVGERVGFDQGGSRFWLTRPLPPEDREKPAVAETLRLLEGLGIEAGEATPRLAVPAGLKAAREALLRALPMGPLACLHPFAGHPGRVSPAALWAPLCRGLRRRGFAPLMLGTASELESLRSGRPDIGEEACWLDLALPGAGLREALLATASCALFIGHDSGPLHAAAAFGAPCAGLYFPGPHYDHAWDRCLPCGPGPRAALRIEDPARLEAEALLEAALPRLAPGAPAAVVSL